MDVLVVDGDAASRQRFRDGLSDDGDVRVAATAEGGLWMVTTRRPKVVLVAITDPAESMAVVVAFKAAAPGAEVIVMTSAYSKDAEELALHLGAFCYIEKGDDEIICGLTLGALLMVTSSGGS